MYKIVFMILALTSSNSSLGFAGEKEALNKKIVREFYEQVFVHHRAAEAAEKYLAADYIQHNPNVATGRKPFVDFFTPFFQKNGEAKSTIMRVIAEGDLVVLHVHSKLKASDPGRAVIDIFRVADGKIVEHWDVMQSVSEKPANQNSMF